jgi:hypothetical protein
MMKDVLAVCKEHHIHAQHALDMAADDVCVQPKVDTNGRLLAKYIPKAICRRSGMLENVLHLAEEFDATEELLSQDLETLRDPGLIFDCKFLAEEVAGRNTDESMFDVECEVDMWLFNNKVFDNTKMTEADLTRLRNHYNVKVD